MIRQFYYRCLFEENKMIYHSAIKKNEILLLETWMDIGSIKLSKTNQAERQRLYDFTYMGNVKKHKKMSKQNENTPIDIDNKLRDAKGEGWGNENLKINK